jgi:hypothetical protein
VHVKAAGSAGSALDGLKEFLVQRDIKSTLILFIRQADLLKTLVYLA